MMSANVAMMALIIFFCLTIASSLSSRNLNKPYFSSPGYRKPLHWVYKVGSLEDTIMFFAKNFGYTISRHEEFRSGCEATCNGDYDGEWSKTLISPQDLGEDSFSLELIYNYGIDQYEKGNGFRYISLPWCAFRGDEKFIIYDHVGRMFIEAPDGSYIHLDETIDEADSSYVLISLHVSNLANSLRFYEDVLGAKLVRESLGSDPGVSPTKMAILSWAGYDRLQSDTRDSSSSIQDKAAERVLIELIELKEGESLHRSPASGRFALETEDGAPSYMASRILRKGGADLTKAPQFDAKVDASAIVAAYYANGAILHGPVKLEPHNEEVVVIGDPDGHEYCFVDARGFEACKQAGRRPGGNVIDWAHRKEVERKAIDAVRERQFNQAVIDFGQFIRPVPSPKVFLEEIHREAGKLREISRTPSAAVLMIYAPWCVLCRNRKVIISDVARQLQALSDDFQYLALDGSRKADDVSMRLSDVPYPSSYADALSNALGWTRKQGFPSLFLFPLSSADVPEIYDGPWRRRSVAEWLLQFIPDSDAICDGAREKAFHELEKLDTETAALMAEDDDEDDCDSCSL